MKLLPLIFLSLLPLFSIGQLITNSSQSPSTLVQNVFSGQGITITNVNYTGSSSSIGYFTANGTNLGMSEGIVMTTGKVGGHPNSPIGPNDREDDGFDNNENGYTLLSNLVGKPTYNASVLEFDFSTCSDHIEFKYIFGSDEFLEFCGTSFNDAFAFFITGPGIGTNQNIAKLPNGLPVAVNNVHPTVPSNFFNDYVSAVNAQYYVNNNNGASIQYDGFTTVLTAEADVICDETYHLILAIADAQDPIYDSGVFLEAHSFNSSEPVDATFTISNNVFGDESIIAEGCVTTTFDLERVACNINTPMTVPITVSGTATEGVDYSNIPSTITFPAGSSTATFSIDAFQDGVFEGPETIILTFHFTDNCGNQSEKTIELTIQELTDLEVEITGQEITCPGEEVELVANVTGGAEPYTYQWSTGETTSSIFVSPTSTETYTVEVVDDCIGIPVIASYEVTVPNIPPLTLNETPDITEICPYISAVLESNASGGTPPYTYQWSSSSGGNLGTGSTQSVTPSQTTTYTVTVTDACGLTESANVVYTITSPPLELDMSPDIEICPGDSAFISVTSTGGYGQHYYYWPHSGETTPGVWVHPSVSTTYTVIVSDECQTFTVQGTTQVIVIKPTADFTTTSTVFFNNLPITFMNLSQNAVDYEWDFGDGNTSTITNPSNTFLDPGIYYITLVAIDDKGCTDTITKPINIEEEWYVYVPNTFTPDGNRSNNDFRVSTVGIRELQIAIYDRWGELIFEAYDKDFVWDGTYGGALVNDGTYTWKIHFITNSGRDKKMYGHVNVLK